MTSDQVDGLNAVRTLLAYCEDQLDAEVVLRYEGELLLCLTWPGLLDEFVYVLSDEAMTMAPEAMVTIMRADLNARLATEVLHELDDTSD